MYLYPNLLHVLVNFHMILPCSPGSFSREGFQKESFKFFSRHGMIW